jgi:phytoene desaturase
MKKITIIGAGIAGLTTGIYGQMNGLETEIYESHTMPGGECTTWARGGYHFDGCIHWLTGSRKGTSIRRIWEDTGALDDSVEIINHEVFTRFELDGRVLNIYTNIDKLESHLLELSPADEPAIRELCGSARSFIGMGIPIDKPYDMIGVTDGLKSITQLPKLQKMKKYGNITLKEFASQFKDPLLRFAFENIVTSPQYPATALISILSCVGDGDGGYPLGGSLAFSRRMEKKYISLGGKINYKSKVSTIIINNGKAVGIMLEDGTEYFSDYVISCADGHATLFDMLGGKYLDEKLRNLYSDLVAYPVPTSVGVYVGIDCDLSHYPHTLTMKAPEEIDVGGILTQNVSLKHYCYDKSLAPQGKSIVASFFLGDFDWWEKKYQDIDAYNQEKDRLAKDVCGIIESRFPEVKGKIEKVDVITPVTYAHYCNAWRGAWMSWINPKEHYFPGNLPGLSNFYMAGQWTMPPGGLPCAATSGRWVIQRICKNESMTFHGRSQRNHI